MENQEQQVNQQATEQTINQVTPPPTGNTTLPIKPSKSFNKWILMTVIFVLILCLSFGGYLFIKKYSTKTQPSPTSTKVVDETANWKTFSDNKFNITFMYPPNWEITTVSSGLTLIPSDKKQNKDYINYPPFSISFINNPDNLSMEKWQEKQNAPDSGNQVHNYISPKTEKITINGNYAYINRIGATCEPSSCYEVFILDNKKIWVLKNYDFSGSIPVGNYPNGQFKVLYTKNEVEANQKIFDALLSTFKFTDQNSQTDTSSWKIYTDEKYGFEFTYPPTGKKLTKTTKGDEFLPGKCGNSITLEKSEIIVPSFQPGPINIDVYSVEGWFSIFIIPWKGTLEEYAKNGYTLAISETLKESNADDARIVTNQNNLPIFKNGDYIYKFSFPQNYAYNECIYDDNTINIINSFKFTQ